MTSPSLYKFLAHFRPLVASLNHLRSFNLAHSLCILRHCLRCSYCTKRASSLQVAYSTRVIHSPSDSSSTKDRVSSTTRHGTVSSERQKRIDLPNKQTSQNSGEREAATPPTRYEPVVHRASFSHSHTAPLARELRNLQKLADGETASQHEGLAAGYGQDYNHRRSSDRVTSSLSARILPNFVQETSLRNSATRRWAQRARANKVSADRDRDGPWVKSTVYPGPVIVCPSKHVRSTIRSEPSFNRQQRAGMSVSVQIVTTPTADANGSTFLLNTGTKHYLFGSAPPGLSRSISGRVARFTGIEQCFVTGRSRWANNGGILGIMLNFAEATDATKASTAAGIRDKIARLSQYTDMKSAEKIFDLGKQLDEISSRPLRLFGAPNLAYHIATARRFIFRKGMPLEVVEIDDDDVDEGLRSKLAPVYTDSHIRVWAMPILPSVSDSGDSTANSRKRSFEELENGSVLPSAASPSSQSQAERYLISDNLSPKAHKKLVINGIISEMFNAGWHLDTLYETKLRDVRLPATIFVRDPSTRKVQKYQGPLPGSSDPAYDSDLEVMVRRPWPGSLLQHMPPTAPSDVAMSYIVRHNDRRGRFLPEKAKALKVPAGRLFADLSSGKAVKNTDGLLITPEQVLEDPRPGTAWAVIDLPDETYIENLLARAEWQESLLMDGLGVIFWSGGLAALHDERIKSFMASLSHVQHIVINGAYTGNYLAHAHAASDIAMLSAIDPARFRVPTYDKPSSEGLSGFSSNVLVGTRDHMIHTEPNLEIRSISNRSRVSYRDGTAAESSAHLVDPQTIQKAKAALQAVEDDMDVLQFWKRSIPGSEVEIIPLGTGSAVPQKTRNVSSTLVRVPGWGSVLLDCGEGTLGQLKRALSTEDFKDVIRGLRMIAITHLHADHHLGTVSIINEWYEQVHGSRPGSAVPFEYADNENLETSQRLAILASPLMHAWLREYAGVEDYGYSRLAPLVVQPRDLPHRDTRLVLYRPKPPSTGADHARSETASHENRRVPPAWLGLTDFQAVHVDHCAGAMAFAVTWPDEFKVSYSGDCRPSANLVDIGKDSTVCIHEATFGNSLHSEAIAKKHSTVGEAIMVADAMNAKACILTHFSQRYSPGTNDNINLLRRLSAQQYTVRPTPHITPQPRVVVPHTEGQTPEFIAKADRVLIGNTRSTDNTSKGTSLLRGHRTVMQVCSALDLMHIKVGEIAQIRYFIPAILDHYWRDQITVLRETNEAAELDLAGMSKKKGSKYEGIREAIVSRKQQIHRVELELAKQDSAELSDEEVDDNANDDAVDTLVEDQQI